MGSTRRDKAAERIFILARQHAGRGMV